MILMLNMFFLLLFVFVERLGGFVDLMFFVLVMVEFFICWILYVIFFVFIVLRMFVVVVGRRVRMVKV